MAQTDEASASGYAVRVTNVSLGASEKHVADFFSFCGQIKQLTLTSLAETKEAVVTFESKAAASTALLLNNALIVDRPITVVMLESADAAAASAAAAAAGTQVDPATIQHRDYNGVPDHERSRTSVIASMLAAGYCLGDQALHKAKDVDEKHMISLQLKVGTEAVKGKVLELDKAYGISEKVHQLDQQYAISTTLTAHKDAVFVKTHALDETYHISRTVTETASTASAKATELAKQSMGNEYVAAAAGAVSSAYSLLAGKFAELTSDTQQAIAERQQHPASGSTAATAAAAAAAPPSAAVDAPTAAPSPAAPAAAAAAPSPAAAPVADVVPAPAAPAPESSPAPAAASSPSAAPEAVAPSAPSDVSDVVSPQ